MRDFLLVVFGNLCRMNMAWSKCSFNEAKYNMLFQTATLFGFNALWVIAILIEVVLYTFEFDALEYIDSTSASAIALMVGICFVVYIYFNFCKLNDIEKRYMYLLVNSNEKFLFLTKFYPLFVVFGILINVVVVVF